MTLHALPPPGTADYDEAKKMQERIAVEARLHAIQQRLQRLQADYKVQRMTKTWPAVDRRFHERRQS